MGKFNSYRIITLLALLLTVSLGNAQETKKLSITNSPIHLSLSILELMAEYQVAPKIGAAGILGYGSITETDNWGDEVEIPILEIGGQLNYYLLGNFDKGMQVGLELLYINLSLPEDEVATIIANGLGIGPYLGYKWTAVSGLTFDIQAGYEKFLAQVKAKDSFGNEIEDSVQGGIPLINLNLGWSF